MIFLQKYVEIQELMGLKGKYGLKMAAFPTQMILAQSK